MKNKFIFVFVMLLSILIVSFGFTNIYVSHQQQTKDEDFVVVTSFYPMYIATMNVIGDTEGITLKNLSEPQTGCLHDFQLTPEDMKLLSTADVFIINGGGIESFMEDIAKQYPELVIIEACEGIDLLCETEEHGHEHEEEHEEHTEDSHDDHSHDVNAHAWMSVANYRKQVENIANGLSEIAPDFSTRFLINASNYDQELELLQEEQEALFTITKDAKTVMLHCAYDYVAEELGLEVAFCMDLDEERQVSAGEVAQVLDIIKNDDVQYVFAEALYGTDMCEMIQKEVDVQVVYLNPLNRGEYKADSYIEGMKENLRAIRGAFRIGGANPIQINSISDCLLEEDGKQHLILPESRYKIRVENELLEQLEDIDLELLKAADKKIYSNVPQYSDQYVYYLEEYEGRLCLCAEIIIDNDSSTEDEEHEHIYFREQIVK